VDNDTQTPERRTPPLLRQVVVPTWLQVLFLGVLGYVLIKWLFTNPLLIVVGIALNLMFIAYVLKPLRRRAGQGTDEDDSAEVAAAPTRKEAAKIGWRKLRTYQVWHLAIMILATTGVLLNAAGISTP
jgi:hypothetical protein